MSVVKINAIEVPEGSGAVLEERFAARAGEVETVDGFESFELLRPTEGTDRYLVVTRWRDEGAFDAWMNSESFQEGHAAARDNSVNDPTSGHPGSESASAAAASGPDEGHPGKGSRGPVASGSELWSFEIVTSAKRA